LQAQQTSIFEEILHAALFQFVSAEDHPVIIDATGLG
jgi:hypothetical protein